MNAHQFKRTWTHFEVDLKQKWNQFTDHDLQEIEGNYETFIGKVQQRYAGENVTLMKWAAAWHQKPATTSEGEEKAS
jgi:uncharacterized protein YjbJ (UPF0337 family)